MFKQLKLVIGAALTATLVACGGGGDESTANADPQGIWTVPASTGNTVYVAILETGEAWGVYSSGSTIAGGLYGTARTNGNSVSITGTDFNFLTNSSTDGTFTGPITAKSSMSLSGNGTASLTYQSIYDIPATSTGVTGTWSFIGRSTSYTLIPATISINSAGAFTLSQTGCVTTGSIVPRPGGKNIYNLTLSGVGANCAVGQSTMSGIAYLDTTVTPNKFLSLALTPSKTDGLIVIGTKQ